MEGGESLIRSLHLKSFLVLALAWFVIPCRATVFLNEVSINPPGSLDDLREYIELQGVPGRKLNGYAIAFLNGGLEKYFPSNSIPPLPDPKPEIDEFFSLDGLQLGANGLLVIGLANASGYPELLSDTEFFGPWVDLWNGGLDIPNRLSNDGSNTVLLIRRRPGRTEADPNNAGGLRWGKGLYQDFEIIRNVIDPQDSTVKDQWGDGNLDKGQSNGLNGATKDVTGFSTFFDTDDLEIVDEISYESDRGWEYDTDDRKVDLDSAVPGLPERRVHALDDPQGFTPDSLTRVDYRTSGLGWATALDALGQLPNGRNWQDTATEQWIRGENDPNVIFTKDGPEIYYWNEQNPNPDAVQFYMTNVPRWLHDGIATEYNFSIFNSYRLLAGRINPLAIPFIPGDVDRDGDCDSADIARIASVFGNADWVFSNAYPEAPQSNDGDPATQTRPWDVDATGDNGIEPSDLQWTLNFQGNTNGRVAGRRYDSPTASTTGVFLNPHSTVQCAATFQVELPDGRPINGLRVGDLIQLTVRAQVTGGARSSPAEQVNGIMQFVHDLTISAGNVVAVETVTPLSPFAPTRASLVLPNVSFDRGVRSINGYSTFFSSGIGAPTSLYRVQLRAVGLGSTQIQVGAAALPAFASSTPRGLKVGRTDDNGNPQLTSYPAWLAVAVTQQSAAPGNCDIDPLITNADHACMADCIAGPETLETGCEPFDLDDDQDVDLLDVGLFQSMFGE